MSRVSYNIDNRMQLQHNNYNIRIYIAHAYFPKHVLLYINNIFSKIVEIIISYMEVRIKLLVMCGA